MQRYNVERRLAGLEPLSACEDCGWTGLSSDRERHACQFCGETCGGPRCCSIDEADL